MLKIGYYNFWDKNVDNFILMLCNSIKDNIILCDCTKEECDIVFVSVFYHLYVIGRNVIKGNPIFISWTGENEDNGFRCEFDTQYSISHKFDTDTNLYFPYWYICVLEHTILLNRHICNKNKFCTKFCTFISKNTTIGNLTHERLSLVKELSKYKTVDCIGPALNNHNGWKLPNNKQEAIDYHKPFKFNLCFENSTNKSNTNYITEKIFNAFDYGTVPIYKGSSKITEIINPKAFINCNNKSISECIDIIKYYDTHDIEYYNMLNEPIFIDINRDWYNYIQNKLDNFILKIVQKHFSNKI